METWLLGAIAGGTAALAMIVAQRGAHRSSFEVLSLLRDRGPLTIPQIMEQLGLRGFSAQGKVVAALDALVRAGRVEEGAVPPGTPALDRIKVRTYRAIRAA